MNAFHSTRFRYEFSHWLTALLDLFSLGGLIYHFKPRDIR